MTRRLSDYATLLCVHRFCCTQTSVLGTTLMKKIIVSYVKTNDLTILMFTKMCVGNFLNRTKHGKLFKKKKQKHLTKQIIMFLC